MISARLSPRGRTLLTIALGAILVAGVLFWGASSSHRRVQAALNDAQVPQGERFAAAEANSATQVRAIARTGSADSEQAAEQDSSGLDTAALVARIASAQSARHLEALLNVLQAQSLEKAITLRANIEGVCATARHPQLQSATSDAAMTIYRTLAEYCANANTSDAAFSRYLSMDLVDYFDVGISELNALRTSDGPEVAMQRAEDQAFAASDRIELDVAMAHLRADAANWRIGLDDAEIVANPSGAAAIRQLALELYGCRVFADCNGRPLRWYTHCTRTLQCSPSESYFDVLRNTHTPREFAAAERLAAELLRRRAERGGAL